MVQLTSTGKNNQLRTIPLVNLSSGPESYKISTHKFQKITQYSQYFGLLIEKIGKSISTVYTLDFSMDLQKHHTSIIVPIRSYICANVSQL